MALQIGIVGLPNVGKSTMFSAITKKQVDCANYPFCTIDPNVGVVEVPDERLAVLSKLSGSKKIIPTIIEFVDIAGLVKGAAEGQDNGIRAYGFEIPDQQFTRHPANHGRGILRRVFELLWNIDVDRQWTFFEDRLEASLAPLQFRPCPFPARKPDRSSLEQTAIRLRPYCRLHRGNC